MGKVIKNYVYHGAKTHDTADGLKRRLQAHAKRIEGEAKAKGTLALEKAHALASKVVRLKPE